MEANQIINQFDLLNRTRIARLSKLVSHKQQAFFSIFPFLIHTNLPELPGYAGQECPEGIMEYQVSDKTVYDTKRLHKQFKYKRQAVRHFGFTSLYLINRYGLLGTPPELDFDVILIHAPLSELQLEALTAKTKSLTKWAAEQFDISLSFTLIDQTQSSQADLSHSQAADLYVNGLVLAGAIPLWWLASLEQKYQDLVAIYGQQSLQTNFSLIDVGDIPDIDAETCAKKLKTQLEQALDDGYQYCLSLIYLEHQLKQFPRSPTLHQRLKREFFEGEREPVNIDIKSLQLAEIMASDDISDEKKKLAQKSLYLHHQENLSQHVSQPKYGWRRDHINVLSKQWQWGNHDYLILDQREYAHYSQANDEHKQTLSLFVEITETLKTFIQQHKLTDIDLTVIEKRLFRFTNPIPNTIGQLPKGINTKVAEEEIHFYRFSNEGKWIVSTLPLDSDKQHGLNRTETLLSAIAWSITNGLLNKATRILVADKTGRIPLNLAISIAQQLLKTDLVLPHELDDTALTQSGKIDKLHLFANIGPEFTQETSVLPEVQLTSLYTDPFNYAGRGESLLYRIDVLLHTSLDEWYTLQFNGLTAPLDLLQHLIAWWNNSPDTHPIECWCPSETHGQIISKRLQQLTKDVSQYYRKHKQAKYITQLADELYQLSWQPEGVDVLSLNTNDQAEAFQNINDRYIAVFLDSQNDRRGLNRAIYKTHKSETVSLLIEPETNGTAIHAIDEFGNLHTQRHLKLHTGTAIKLYQQFLSAVRKQKPDLHVEFHQLVKSATGIWQTKPLKITQQETKREYLPVIVELKSPALDTECTITCGPTVFTGRANDINLFADLSIFIYGLRNNRIEYPLYINELLFSDPSQANTGHYFIHKKHFEEQLNHQ